MEAKLSVSLLPRVLPIVDQSSTEMHSTLPSLITMETATPPPRAEIVAVRVEQIKDVVICVAELGNNLGVEEGSVIVGKREQVALLHGELVPEDADPSLEVDLQQGSRLLHPPVRPRPNHLRQVATVSFGLCSYGGGTHFTFKEGKQHQSRQFPGEPGGTSTHHLKDESYKEFAACMGSNLPCSI
jgi:hypothetical protein